VLVCPIQLTYAYVLDMFRPFSHFEGDHSIQNQAVGLTVKVSEIKLYEVLKYLIIYKNLSVYYCCLFVYFVYSALLSYYYLL